MARDTRLKENQETFRLANERLVAAVGERVAAAERVPFLCECAEETCMGRIAESASYTSEREYADVSTRFRSP